MTYEVTVKYSGIVSYIIEADSKEAAEEQGRELYVDGSLGDIPGFDWETTESITAKETQTTTYDH